MKRQYFLRQKIYIFFNTDAFERMWNLVEVAHFDLISYNFGKLKLFFDENPPWWGLKRLIMV